MRKSARIYLQSTLLVAVTAGILVPSVQAGSIGSTYGGFVSGTTTGTFPANVALNDIISTSSSFGYAVADAGIPVAGKYVFTSTSIKESFGVLVNYPTPNSFSANSWSDNYVPSSSATFFIQMSKSGSTVTMDIHATGNGGTGSKATSTIDLILTSTVYTTTILPQTQAQLSEFFTTAARLVWDPSPITGQGTPEFEGVINIFGGVAVATVPEPSTFVMMSVATVTCGIGLAISRRRRARAA
jgi:hypothetical protein